MQWGRRIRGLRARWPAKAARTPAFSKKVEQEGLVISAGSPAELDAYVRAEDARWRKIVRENAIKPD